MRLVLTLIAIVCCMSQTLPAADNLTLFEGRKFVGTNGELNYCLLTPKEWTPVEDKAVRRYPLVLFLHGAGERGSDNRKQLVHGMSEFASDLQRQQHPAFVIAPQCPEGEQWVDVPWSGKEHEMKAKPSKSLGLVLELIQQHRQHLPIDEQRIYVTGLSMGGFGTWDLIQREPELFAAAIPICGGGDVRVASRIKHVPIWAFHGDGDTTVMPSRSRDMIEAIRTAGGKPIYTEYVGVGHDSWTATYKNQAVLDWLFAQSRPASN